MTTSASLRILSLLSVALMLSVCLMMTIPADADGDTHQDFMDSINIQKIEDYLYTAEYSTYDWEKGQEYADNRYKPTDVGGCSALSYESKIIGRNFDWYYDNSCDFVVKTKNADGRYATIGICNTSTAKIDGISLTNEFVQTGQYSELYEILPFVMLDGINEKGLVAETNVVPSDYGLTVGTNPGKEDLCTMLSVRFVLDYASDVDEAIELLSERNIYSPHTPALNTEIHLMLADGNKTVEIEFIDNEMKVIDNVKAVTNFHLYGEKPTSHAEGLERYNSLMEQYDSIGASENKTEKMLDVMKSIFFTKAYSVDTEPIWYSEFTGYTNTFGDLTVDATYNEDRTVNIVVDEEQYAGILSYVKNSFENRSRTTGDTWQTVHTCIYDIENRELTVLVQEGSQSHRFALSDEQTPNNDAKVISNTLSLVGGAIALLSLIVFLVFYGDPKMLIITGLGIIVAVIGFII